MERYVNKENFSKNLKSQLKSWIYFLIYDYDNINFYKLLFSKKNQRNELNIITFFVMSRDEMNERTKSQMKPPKADHISF